MGADQFLRPLQGPGQFVDGDGGGVGDQQGSGPDQSGDLGQHRGLDRGVLGDRLHHGGGSGGGLERGAGGQGAEGRPGGQGAHQLGQPEFAVDQARGPVEPFPVDVDQVDRQAVSEGEDGDSDAHHPGSQHGEGGSCGGIVVRGRGQRVLLRLHRSSGVRRVVRRAVRRVLPSQSATASPVVATCSSMIEKWSPGTSTTVSAPSQVERQSPASADGRPSGVEARTSSSGAATAGGFQSSSRRK